MCSPSPPRAAFSTPALDAAQAIEQNATTISGLANCTHGYGDRTRNRGVERLVIRYAGSPRPVTHQRGQRPRPPHTIFHTYPCKINSEE